MHEASLYDSNLFVTLTYSDECLPVRGQLHYPHFKAFMRRYAYWRVGYDLMGRRVVPQSRFFVAGEYGEKFRRPHYHAILFDCHFPDMVPLKRLTPGNSLYRSPTLEKLWPHGHSSIGMVTLDSAQYVAQYCVKKVTGKGAMQHYTEWDEYGEFQRVPEFARMSLRPGIGARWFDEFGSLATANDYVSAQGQEIPLPRYYDKRFAAMDPVAAEEVKQRRILDALEKYEENTEARLREREIVATAKVRRRDYEG